MTDTKKMRMMEIALNTPEVMTLLEEENEYYTRVGWIAIVWNNSELSESSKGYGISYEWERDPTLGRIPESAVIYFSVHIGFVEPARWYIRLAIDLDTEEVVFTDGSPLPMPTPTPATTTAPTSTPTPTQVPPLPPPPVFPTATSIPTPTPLPTSIPTPTPLVGTQQEQYLSLSDGSESSIFLVESELHYGVYDEDIFPYQIDKVYPKKGDPAAIIQGTIRNDDQEDLYLALSADAYDSEGWKLDPVVSPWSLFDFAQHFVHSGNISTFMIHIPYEGTDVATYHVFLRYRPSTGPAP